MQMGFIRKLAVRGYSKELKKMIDDLSKHSTGRRFQFGEGWHSSKNTVRFWNTITFQKERYARCYASATAYAKMISACNMGCARLNKPKRSPSCCWRRGPWPAFWPCTSSNRCGPNEPSAQHRGPLALGVANVFAVRALSSV